MPYSKRGSQTCIYPDTIRQLSMSARTQTRLLMSTQSQAINQSFPNQWAQCSYVSMRTIYHVNRDTSS